MGFWRRLRVLGAVLPIVTLAVAAIGVEPAYAAGKEIVALPRGGDMAPTVGAESRTSGGAALLAKIEVGGLSSAPSGCDGTSFTLPRVSGVTFIVVADGDTQSLAGGETFLVAVGKKATVTASPLVGSDKLSGDAWKKNDDGTWAYKNAIKGELDATTCVVLAAPTSEPAACAGTRWSIQQTPGVAYTVFSMKPALFTEPVVLADKEKATLTARAEEGYTIVATKGWALNDVGAWEYNKTLKGEIDPATCTSLTLAAPVASAPGCNGTTWTLPDGAGVTYTVVSEGTEQTFAGGGSFLLADKVKATVTAQVVDENHMISGPTELWRNNFDGTWTLKGGLKGDRQCKAVEAAVPTVSQPMCDGTAIEMPTAPGVVYQAIVNGTVFTSSPVMVKPGDLVTVTAQPELGYRLKKADPDGTLSFPIAAGPSPEDCDEIAPVLLPETAGNSGNPGTKATRPERTSTSHATPLPTAQSGPATATAPLIPSATLFASSPLPRGFAARTGVIQVGSPGSAVFQAVAPFVGPTEAPPVGAALIGRVPPVHRGPLAATGGQTTGPALGAVALIAAGLIALVAHRRRTAH